MIPGPSKCGFAYENRSPTIYHAKSGDGRQLRYPASDE